MQQISEQLIALDKAGLDSAMRAASITLDGLERSLEVQIKTAKSMLDNVARRANSLAECTYAPDPPTLSSALAKPNLEDVTGCAKAVYEVAASAQLQMGGIVEKRLTAASRQAIAIFEHCANSAAAASHVELAGANVMLSALKLACDNMLKSPKRLANASAAEDCGSNADRKDRLLTA